MNSKSNIWEGWLGNRPLTYQQNVKKNFFFWYTDCRLKKESIIQAQFFKIPFLYQIYLPLLPLISYKNHNVNRVTINLFPILYMGFFLGFPILYFIFNLQDKKTIWNTFHSNIFLRLQITDLNSRKCYMINILSVKILNIASKDVIIDAQVFILLKHIN